ncbi:MAG: sulfite exporter TauE/SafE family protein [bacterium]|nr:sulfite exporter TauE/SafE family protein [bacterium]
MELWTAFIIGLAGSAHCIGMCGPIVIALPSASGRKSRFVMGRLLYNIGRTVTYAAMGAVSGLIGHTIVAGGYQQTLSLTLGIIILILILFPKGSVHRLIPFDFYHRFIGKLKFYWSRLFKSDSYGSLFLIGLLNGFLPCGLVYVALAGAATTGSPLLGMGYMATFGIGTIPVMLVASLVGGMVGRKVKSAINRLLPVGGVMLAALLILRGLSLGIPYISPKMKVNQETGAQEVHDCCKGKATTPNAALPDTVFTIDSTVVDSTYIR